MILHFYTQKIFKTLTRGNLSGGALRICTLCTFLSHHWLLRQLFIQAHMVLGPIGAY